MPKAIDNDTESRSRRIQAQFTSYRPLTRAQYASHVVMFEETFDISLAKAKPAELLRYLKSLSSKGVKRRGIQALRAYVHLLQTKGVRTDDPMAEISIGLVHTDPPSLESLRDRLTSDGIDRKVVRRLTWLDLTLMSVRARPFQGAPRRSSGLAGLYLDGRIRGRCALRVLRARAAKPLFE